jgi:hypothetical protein
LLQFPHKNLDFLVSFSSSRSHLLFTVVPPPINSACGDNLNLKGVMPVIKQVPISVARPAAGALPSGDKPVAQTQASFTLEVSTQEDIKGLSDIVSKVSTTRGVHSQ